MVKIKEFEEIMNGEKIFAETGINSTLYWAYVNSKVTEKEDIDFDDIIWIREIPDIINQLKKYNIKQFTISSTFSSLLESMAALQKFGCEMVGLTEINARHIDFFTGERGHIPAIKFILK
jgi:hypothetical protein